MNINDNIDGGMLARCGGRRGGVAAQTVTANVRSRAYNAYQRRCRRPFARICFIWRCSHIL